MITHPRTTHRDLDRLKDVLARLVAGVRERLGANYIGAYLQGSLATGGFDDASDIDFLNSERSELRMRLDLGRGA